MYYYQMLEGVMILTLIKNEYNGEIKLLKQNIEKEKNNKQYK